MTYEERKQLTQHAQNWRPKEKDKAYRIATRLGYKMIKRRSHINILGPDAWDEPLNFGGFQLTNRLNYRVIMGEHFEANAKDIIAYCETALQTTNNIGEQPQQAAN